jgi:hypothetical protein
MNKSWEPTEDEIRAISEAITAARKIQTFLWGEANGNWGLEEWLRMFRKRVAKLEEIKTDNPHASVELKKRLLQVAALSVALIGIIDRDGVPWQAAPNAPPSNLPEFTVPVTTTTCECWEGINDREGMPPCEHQRLIVGRGPFNCR